VAENWYKVPLSVISKKKVREERRGKVARTDIK
jgi:hypothetical protein